MEKIEEPSTDTLLSRNEIPIIDLAYMGPVTTPIKPWLRKIADQLNRSLSTKGLVFLVNHGITEERLKAVYKIMDKFCDLPDDIKNGYRLNPPEDNQGYVPAGMERFNREWRREMRHSYNIQNFSRKIPAKEIPNFEDTVGGVAEEFRRLASILLQIIAVSLDLESDKFLSFHKGMMKQDNASTFRMLYYPPLGEAPLPYATRCGEHTDYGTFTLLTQDTEGGLEVYSGGKWCSVGHLPGAILVNLGELIESWSSSRYKAIKHRVVIPDESKLRTRSRHSIAFFVHPDDNTVVDPAMFLPPLPAENVEEHRHITLMTAYQHLQQRLRQSYDKRNLTTYSKHDAYRCQYSMFCQDDVASRNFEMYLVSLLKVAQGGNKLGKSWKSGKSHTDKEEPTTQTLATIKEPFPRAECTPAHPPSQP